MKPVYDHQGQRYPSIAAMCRTYDKAPSLIKQRLDKGWSLEAALTTPVYHQAVDHLGNVYKTTDAMLKAYRIASKTYYERMARGWSLEAALTTPPAKNHKGSSPVEARTDHTGVVYDSINAMLKAYGIQYMQYYTRIRRGWTKEEALTGIRKAILQ